MALSDASRVRFPFSYTMGENNPHLGKRLTELVDQTQADDGAADSSY